MLQLQYIQECPFHANPHKTALYKSSFNPQFVKPKSKFRIIDNNPSSANSKYKIDASINRRKLINRSEKEFEALTIKYLNINVGKDSGLVYKVTA